MEEAALEVTGFLVRLIWPTGLIAVCVGLVTLGVAIFPPKKARAGGSIIFGGNVPGNRSPIAERIAVGLCTPISLLGLVVAFQTVRLRSASEPPYRPLSVLLVLATIVMGLPAIFWKTRLRLAAEALATIALAVASILAGFSIGFIFVPLTVLMIWICVRHLREVDNAPTITGASSG
jgi:hypothetical protein